MKKINKKLILKAIFGIGVLFLVFYSGYRFGEKYGRILNPPSGIKNGSNQVDQSLDFGLFWQTWNNVRELYIGSSDPKEMLYGAISGMVASLGDPYTVFLKPSDNEALSADLSGQFEGIGAELTEENGQIIVIAPLSGSPAEKAGIKPKDQILKIDGQSTDGIGVDAAVTKIRGRAGTEVSLTVKHSGQNDPVEIKITRESIHIDSVTYQTVDYNGHKIAVLKVSQFGDDTVSLTKKYAGEMNTNNVVGVIVDLRSNPGGYLDRAVEFSNVFLARGALVLKEVDKNQQTTEYKTENDPLLGDIPMMILVNGGSASASEIVTGAMMDNNRAKVVGEKTFGKGVVQQLEPLTDGAALKVTIAKWLTPSGKEINQVGITPDIVITNFDVTSGNDPQMNRAKIEISKLIK